MLIKETSERSDRYNWVKKEMLAAGINIVEFEGYTVKENQVSTLLDRALIRDENFDTEDEDKILENIISLEGHSSLLGKAKYSKRLNAPYLYMLYSYFPEKIHIYIIDIKDDVISIKRWRDASFIKFALYISKNRDQWMSSKYEEDGLPLFDTVLRLYNNYALSVHDGNKLSKIIEDLLNRLQHTNPNEAQIKYYNNIRSKLQYAKANHKHLNDSLSISYTENGKHKQIGIIDAAGKIAWAGNLDGLIINEEGEAQGIIEFQTVTKGSVSQHCNNEWFFQNGRNRKDDQKRWQVAFNIWQSSNLPFYIIVWSPNETEKSEKNIKFKKVQDIIFNENGEELGRDKGLIYSQKEMLTIEEVISQIQNKK